MLHKYTHTHTHTHVRDTWSCFINSKEESQFLVHLAEPNKLHSPFVWIVRVIDQSTGQLATRGQIRNCGVALQNTFTLKSLLTRRWLRQVIESFLFAAATCLREFAIIICNFNQSHSTKPRNLCLYPDMLCAKQKRIMRPVMRRRDKSADAKPTKSPAN